MTKRRDKYEQVWDGVWFRPTMLAFREQCCDCGLVHVVDFRRVAGGGIKFRARIDARATAAIRRKKSRKRC